MKLKKKITEKDCQSTFKFSDFLPINQYNPQYSLRNYTVLSLLIAL